MCLVTRAIRAHRPIMSMVPSIVDNCVPLSEVGHAPLCCKVSDRVRGRRRFQRQTTPTDLSQNRSAGCRRQNDASLLVLIIFPAFSLPRFVPLSVLPLPSWSPVFPFCRLFPILGLGLLPLSLSFWSTRTLPRVRDNRDIPQLNPNFREAGRCLARLQVHPGDP